MLTGTLENLRKQTQERLDEGFVGLASSEALQARRFDKTIGVGVLNPDRMATVFTSVSSDFRAATMNQIGFRLASINDPVLLVVKKHKAVLENLRNWLRDYNAVDGTISQPLLLVDDEADNASVNTNVVGADPTQINRCIRSLLDLFSRNSYVGFTATPFANIFINPDSDSAMESDDLFPRDFIYALEAPTNYMGASSIFGDVEQRVVRDIDDAEPAFPKKHKSSFQVGELPQSLKDAINSFLLACTIRDLRGEGPTHRSMLVNVSRFTDVQMQLQALIAARLEDIKQDVRSYGSLPIADAMQNGSLSALYLCRQDRAAADGQLPHDGISGGKRSGAGDYRVAVLPAGQRFHRRLQSCCYRAHATFSSGMRPALSHEGRCRKDRCQSSGDDTADDRRLRC
ncbi:MAG: Z1 domain-containing protein [Edaphobacter sp.]